MHTKWPQPEPGTIMVVLLGAGLGVVWLLVGLALALSGALGTTGGAGSWNIPGPALTPLGLLRLLLLFPEYATIVVIDLIIMAGLQPSFGVVVALALLFSVGTGALTGALLILRA